MAACGEYIQKKLRPNQIINYKDLPEDLDKLDLPKHCKIWSELYIWPM